MATAYLMRGLPASGKTTRARELIAAHPLGEVLLVSRDGLRRMALPPDYLIPVGAGEKPITIMAHAAVSELLTAGVSVIVDDTNLHPHHFEALIEVCEAASARIDIIDLTGVAVEVCVTRDLLRGPDRVGEDVIRAMYTQYLATPGLTQRRGTR